MDEDDSMAAEAHQQELEAQRWDEESAIARSRRLTRELRKETAQFERECEAHNKRFSELTRVTEL
jgi:hypothetical protein